VNVAAATRLRPSLGEQDYAIIETAMLYFIDTFDDGVEGDPDVTAVISKATDTRRRLIAHRRKAGLYWEGEDHNDPDGSVSWGGPNRHPATT
jgi:hypothetical protein